MKRVLSISTLFPNAYNPRFGTFVARSLEGLAARGDYDVTVINPIGVPPIVFGHYRDLADAAVDGDENGLHVHRPTFTLIPRYGVRINAQIIGQTILPLAQKLHRKNPFDLVDAQFFYPDGHVAATIAESLKLPFSIKARGSDINFWGKREFAKGQMIKAADKAKGLLAVSGALAGEMAALGMDRDKITVHYTGLDQDKFRPLQHTGLRRKLAAALNLEFPKNFTLICSVGALIPLKGQELIIEALRELPDVHLLLVGKGNDEARLRTLVKDMGVAERVHFLGLLDHNLLPVVLSASKAMVLPSSNEGLANAWVEALACGTPLVITDVGGAKELLTSADAGVIVERDAASVANGIREVLARDTKPEVIAAEAARFSWENNAEELARYYDGLIG